MARRAERDVQRVQGSGEHVELLDLTRNTGTAGDRRSQPRPAGPARRPVRPQWSPCRPWPRPRIPIRSSARGSGRRSPPRPHRSRSTAPQRFAANQHGWHRPTRRRAIAIPLLNISNPMNGATHPSATAAIRVNEPGTNPPSSNPGRPLGSPGIGPAAPTSSPAQHLAQRRQGIVEQRPRPGQRHVARRVVLRPPTQREGPRQPATGEPVHRGQLLTQHNGIAPVPHVEHRRHQLDPFGTSRRRP